MNKKRARSRDQEKRKTKILNKEDQHYKVLKDEVFHNRYVQVGFIQDGTFGRVLRTYDKEENCLKAIKIIKSKERHILNAKIEYTILQEVNNKDRNDPGCNKIVRAYEAFQHNNNYCIVFEDLGLSLYQYMKIHHFHGFDIIAIQKILKDCLSALAYMHKIGYTHTDLKPENILLSSKKEGSKLKFDIKLIDLGGAVSDSDQHTSLINTRQYRAPEVMLRNTWTKQSDMWCLGCVAIELFTGQLYFRPGDDDFYHLAMIEKTSGPIPNTMIKRCNNYQLMSCFNDYQLNDSFLKWPDSHWIIQKLQLMKTIDTLIPEKYNLFADLLHKLMLIEPHLRITAQEALQHQFFSEEY